MFFSDSFSSILNQTATQHPHPRHEPSCLASTVTSIRTWSEATTKIENAKKHHEKSLEIPKCVDEKKNQPLQNSSLFEINHTKRFCSPCWMRLFDSARPSSHHHRISKSSPRSFFVFSASSRAWRPSLPTEPRLSQSLHRPRFCSSPAAKARAPAAPMLFCSR